MQTLTADKTKRIRIPGAKPNQVFIYAMNPDGSFTLTPLVKADVPQSKVRLEKRGKYTVMVTGRTIDNEEILREIRELS